MTQPDIILPSQHFGPRRKQAPEHRLMMAVLHDALDCVQKYRFATSARGQRLFHEAKQWFLADETGWPYSFECICGVLDLDPNAVRHSVCGPCRGNQRVVAPRATWTPPHRDLATVTVTSGSNGN